MPITVKIKGIDILLKKKLTRIMESPLSKPEWQTIGDNVVDKMLKLIASGVSTVRGSGLPTKMFAYKNPDKYPGKRSFINADGDRVTTKAKSTVNLHLTGNMLDALRADSFNNGFLIEYKTNKADKKETGHRDGKNGQPRRPTIPFTELGEDFAASIRKIWDDAIRKRIKQIIKS